MDIASKNNKQIILRRVATYVALVLAMSVGHFLLRKSTWQGSALLFTLSNVIPIVLAVIIGIVGLVRFYSKKTNIFLFISIGFLGTAFLDCYHAIVNSYYFYPPFPPTLYYHLSWSWFASSFFLSLFFWLSWAAWKREERKGLSVKINERNIFLSAGFLTILCLILTSPTSAFSRKPFSPAARADSRDILLFGPSRIPEQGILETRQV
jgi:hypothetical protein